MFVIEQKPFIYDLSHSPNTQIHTQTPGDQIDFFQGPSKATKPRRKSFSDRKTHLLAELDSAQELHVKSFRRLIMWVEN